MHTASLSSGDPQTARGVPDTVPIPAQLESGRGVGKVSGREAEGCVCVECESRGLDHLDLYRFGTRYGSNSHTLSNVPILHCINSQPVPVTIKR